MNEVIDVFCGNTLRDKFRHLYFDRRIRACHKDPYLQAAYYAVVPLNLAKFALLTEEQQQQTKLRAFRQTVNNLFLLWCSCNSGPAQEVLFDELVALLGLTRLERFRLKLALFNKGITAHVLRDLIVARELDFPLFNNEAKLKNETRNQVAFIIPSVCNNRSKECRDRDFKDIFSVLNDLHQSKEPIVKAYRNTDLTDSVQEDNDKRQSQQLDSYHYLREQLLYFKDHPWKAYLGYKFSRKEEYNDFYNLLYMLYYCGDMAYIESLFDRYFLDDDPDNPQKQLNAFLNEACQQFMRLPGTDLSEHGYDKSLKHSKILRPFKILINHFSERYDLSLRINSEKIEDEPPRYSIGERGPTSYDKEVYRRNKKRATVLGLLVGFFTALGQAIFGVFTLGSWPLGLALFIGTMILLSNTRLFSVDIRDVNIDYFIKFNFLQGCTSTKGKLLVVGIALLVLGFSLLQAALIFTGTVGLFAVPGLLPIMLGVALAAVTFYSFFCLFNVSLIGAYKRISNGIAKVKDAGYGNWPFITGMGNIISNFFTEKWQQLVNPTGKALEDVGTAELWRARLVQVAYWLFQSVLLLAGLAFTFFALATTAASTTQSFAGLLTGWLHVSASASLTLAKVTTFVFFLPVEVYFTFRCICEVTFPAIGNFLWNGLLAPIGTFCVRAFTEPRALAFDIAQGFKRAAGAAWSVTKNIYYNPLASVVPLGSWCMNKIIYPVIYVFNSVSGGVFAQNAGTSTLNSWFRMPPKMAQPIAFFSGQSGSFGGNKKAFDGEANKEIATGFSSLKALKQLHKSPGGRQSGTYRYRDSAYPVSRRQQHADVRLLLPSFLGGGESARRGREERSFREPLNFGDHHHDFHPNSGYSRKR